MQCWKVPKDKQDEARLQRKARDELVICPHSFLEEMYTDCYLRMEGKGGMIGIRTTNTWISAGGKNTVMIWPLTDGFVADTIIRHVWLAK
jgi:hypothetical protein